MREYIADETVDLVYLDPPFNSNASYNVLFREKTGEESPAQIRAFTDTWQWTQESERTYEQEIILNPRTPPNVKEMMSSFRRYIGSNAMMAYLVMMAPRLVELRRVLKPTGSIYLHCDPTASHYLKILMDSVFGQQCFRNEITWKRTTIHRDARRLGRVHDSILFYSKGPRLTWNTVFGKHNSAYIQSHYTQKDSDGRRYRLDNATAAGQGPVRSFFGKVLEPPPGTHWRWSQDNIDNLIAEGRIVLTSRGRPAYKRYLDEMKGTPIADDWHDIPPINSQAKERLGYPTQKPQALLERIISASSNPGDVVLDPFCGCGTAVAAAEKLNRRWIGIDVNHLAVALMKNRIKTAFDLSHGKDYLVVGEPADVGSARALAEQDRYQFQIWAMSLLEALPRESGKKGADRGIDGVVYFIDGPRRATRKAIVQVKSGKVSSPHIRDLKGTVDREKAALGLFITLEEPTNAMRTEAVSAGYYRSEVWQRDYPKIQIRTVGELLSGLGFDLPYHPSMYQPAERVQRPTGEQGMLMEGSKPYADKV